MTALLLWHFNEVASAQAVCTQAIAAEPHIEIKKQLIEHCFYTWKTK